MGERRNETRLRREVLPPQNPHSGIGVMLAAVAAMFFAVISSALMLRTACPAHRARSTPVLVEVNPPAVPSGQATITPGCTRLERTCENSATPCLFTLCGVPDLSPTSTDFKIHLVERPGSISGREPVGDSANLGDAIPVELIGEP